MSLYFQRKSAVDVSINSSFDESISGDFLQDPELNKDELPQPYRMINKVLYRLLESVWEIVSKDERERILESQRYKPPQHQCENDCAIDKYPLCLQASPNGEFVFVGCKGSLIVINSETRSPVANWDAENIDFIVITTTYIDNSTYLLTTIDDMGVGRLFVFSSANSSLYFLQNLNESDGSVASKVIVDIAKASTNSDYLGFYVKDQSAKESWLEIHRLPKSTWLKEISTVKVTPRRQLSSEIKVAEEGVNQIENHLEAIDGKLSQSRPQSPGSSQPKFTPSSFLFRIKAPQFQVSGKSWKLWDSAKSDSIGNVIGTGNNHLLSPDHLQQREECFNSSRLHLNPTETKPATNKIGSPIFHFVGTNRFFPTGKEGTDNTEVPSILILSWKETHQIMHYSLNKPYKETSTEPKPMLVWPFSSHIVALSVTDDNCVMAALLGNNNLLTWHLQEGQFLGITHLTQKGPSAYTTLEILSPNLCTQPAEVSPGVCNVSFYIMVSKPEGIISLVEASTVLSENGHINDRSSEIYKSDENFTYLRTINEIPRIVITVRQNGRIYLHDIQTGDVVYEITLPTGFKLATPWKPKLTLGSNGIFLFLLAINKEEPEILTLRLDSLSNFDRYMENTKDQNSSYSIKSSIDERIDAILKERVNLQGARVLRLQKRWYQYQDELKRIEAAKTCRTQESQIDRVKTKNRQFLKNIHT